MSKSTVTDIHLDLDRMRVICQWDEPRQVVLNKNSMTVAKRKSVSLRVTQGGRLNRQDRERLEGHPKMPAVYSFLEAMKRNNLLPMNSLEPHTCEICGESSRVFPHYAPGRKKVVWRCGAHRYHDESTPKGN